MGTTSNRTHIASPPDIAKMLADAAKRRVDYANVPNGYSQNISPTYDHGLPEWYALNSLHEELGDEFRLLAPDMYRKWSEQRNIVNHRKAKALIGA